MKLSTLMDHAVLRRARGTLCMRVIRIMLAGAVLASAVAPANTVQAASKKKDKREIAAREAFAEGRYQDALDIFAKLYAEKLHPTYLRNIGRCYQNLKEPDKAINAFRDYIRQGKDITAAEEKEVEGYIAEMEALKKKQQDEQAARALPPPVPIPLPTPKPEDDPNRSAAGAVVFTDKPAEPTPAPSQPFYTRGWFWGVVGVVVVAGVVGGLFAGGVFSSKDQCPSGTTCKNLGGTP